MISSSKRNKLLLLLLYFLLLFVVVAVDFIDFFVDIYFEAVVVDIILAAAACFC